MDDMKLTAMEMKVLDALWDSADSNGHDFGLIEDARTAVETPSQLGGVIASLVKKGIIIVEEAVTTDSGTWTQFVWVDQESAESRSLPNFQTQEAR